MMELEHLGLDHRLRTLVLILVTTLLSWCLNLHLPVTERGKFWFSLMMIEAKFCGYSMVISAQDSRGGPGLL